MMTIPIGDRFLISSDTYQWIVNKKRTRAGKSCWTPITYHSTFGGAIHSLGQRWVRESDADTLAEALVAVENVTTQLSQTIPDTLRIKILSEEWFQIDNRAVFKNDQ
jgi:hypothetical protein